MPNRAAPPAAFSATLSAENALKAYFSVSQLLLRSPDAAERALQQLGEALGQEEVALWREEAGRLTRQVTWRKPGVSTAPSGVPPAAAEQARIGGAPAWTRAKDLGLLALPAGEAGVIVLRGPDGPAPDAEALRVLAGLGALLGDALRPNARDGEGLSRKAAALQRAQEELEQLAYAVSHDLQEPLRMVTSYLQFLERRYKGKLDADADEFIHYAVDGAVRMRGLIRDLLTYSRVGTHAEPHRSLSSDAALREALEELQDPIAQSGATIDARDLPEIVGEPRQIAMLLRNLLDNAVKFRGDAPPRVQIFARKQGSDWLFAVQDNGIGFEPRYAERIFAIFQRLHAREQYPGTGTGLAVAKRIVERHGGRIWAESVPGQGSTFFFTIPAA